MTDWRLRTALERRYDGPIPSNAAVPPDYRLPFAAQNLHRRKRAWAEVRRIGHLLVAAHRALHATHDRRHFHSWKRLRRELAAALGAWAAFRAGGTGQAAAPHPPAPR